MSEGAVRLVRPVVEVTIVARNPAALRAFYQDVIGMRDGGDQRKPGGVSARRLTAGQSTIQLLDLGRHAPQAPAGPVGIVEVAIAVHDLDAVLDRAGQSPADTEKLDGMRVWSTTDPDGNAVRVFDGDGATASPCRVHVTLAAVDPDATLAYYCGTLGLPFATPGDPLLWEAPSGIVAGDARIGIVRAPAGTEPADGRPHVASGPRSLLAVVESASDLLGTVRLRGGAVVAGPVTAEGVDAFVTADPDGTWIEFVSGNGG